jgi:integrase
VSIVPYVDAMQTRKARATFWTAPGETAQVCEGASIKAVSTYLGHSSTAITMDMYVHASLDKTQKVRRSYDADA